MNWWVLKRKVHTSWLIAIACAGIFVGICLAQLTTDSVFSSIIILIIASLIVAIILWRKYIYLIPFLIIAGVLIGL